MWLTLSEVVAKAGLTGHCHRALSQHALQKSTLSIKQDHMMQTFAKLYTSESCSESRTQENAISSSLPDAEKRRGLRLSCACVFLYTRALFWGTWNTHVDKLRPVLRRQGNGSRDIVKNVLSLLALVYVEQCCTLCCSR